MDSTVLHKTGKQLEDMTIENIAMRDTESDAPYQTVLAEHPSGSISLALSLLDQRELFCVVKSHGLDGHDKETYQQIGKSLGVTRGRVDQILQKAYAKIRDSGFTLEDFA
jgi:RNA polymerase sigma factor (sigma-70 family)